MSRTFFKKISALLFLFAFSACATQGNAPIESRGAPPPKYIYYHVVEPGDTLYSISWRYEKDHRLLARLNGISPPYTIHPGQRLRIDGTDRVQVQQAPAETGSTSTVRTVSVPNSTVRTASASNTNTSTVNSNSPEPPLPESVEGWAWPLSGKIVTPFGDTQLTKGITLETSGVTEVKASADGVVVYAGSGIRGYGNFLILKHSDLFLSAYAYNSELIAKEGDSVTQGQLIAKSGEDKEGLPRLYFEIRKDGTPVDPIRYLPRR